MTLIWLVWSLFGLKTDRRWRKRLVKMFRGGTSSSTITLRRSLDQPWASADLTEWQAQIGLQSDIHGDSKHATANSPSHGTCNVSTGVPEVMPRCCSLWWLCGMCIPSDIWSPGHGNSIGLKTITRVRGVSQSSGSLQLVVFRVWR